MMEPPYVNWLPFQSSRKRMSFSSWPLPWPITDSTEGPSAKAAFTVVAVACRVLVARSPSALLLFGGWVLEWTVMASGSTAAGPLGYGVLMGGFGEGCW